jgi:hypothetical protein
MSPRLHHLYDYVSDRWVNDAYEMAYRRRSRPDINIKLQIPLPLPVSLDIGVQPKEINTENRYERAQKVYEILQGSDFVDSLKEVNKGRFVWVPDMPLTLATLPIMGLTNPVAWMYASYEDPAAGRTFISLCGSSVNNYIGLASGDRETIQGWYPSASGGLHAIVESLSNERNGVGEWDRLVSEPGRHEFYNLLAALTELPRGHVVEQAFVEVLAFVFFAERDVEIRFNGPSGVRGHFDTVLVGAPVWVRSAVARPLGTDPTMPQGFERSIEDVGPRSVLSTRVNRSRRWWPR